MHILNERHFHGFHLPLKVYIQRVYLIELQRSEVPVYKRMFEFMSGPNQLNVKSYSDGIKLVREKKGECFC